MKKWNRREIRTYQIISGLLGILVLCFFMKGVYLSAADGHQVKEDASGWYGSELFFQKACSDNSFVRYVTKEKQKDFSIASAFANSLAINYYVAHTDPDLAEDVIQTDGSVVKSNGKNNLEEDASYYKFDEEDNNMEDESTKVNTEDEALRALAEQENNHAKEEENIFQLPDEINQSNQEKENFNTTDEDKTLEIIYTEGKVEKIEEPEVQQVIKPNKNTTTQNAISVKNIIKENFPLDKMKNMDYLLNNYYIVDSSTRAVSDVFKSEALLSKDLTIQKKDTGPQILIYHTHASETYCDSRAGVEEDTVVGPGNYLTELLTDYGYNVYHDKTAYDRKNGQDNRNFAYSTARPSIEKILAENPSIEVVIDLHRDSGKKRVTEVDGKPMAQIMFFNGLCRNANGPIPDLENPNLSGNLAFSLQSNLVGRTLYPSLLYRIYLKNYRYNQHFKERCLLIELGTDKNTVQEAYNSMKPLAAILDQVLSNP